jgi:hypothetical protein
MLAIVLLCAKFFESTLVQYVEESILPVGHSPSVSIKRMRMKKQLGLPQ